MKKLSDTTGGVVVEEGCKLSPPPYFSHWEFERRLKQNVF